MYSKTIENYNFWDLWVVQKSQNMITFINTGDSF